MRSGHSISTYWLGRALLLALFVAPLGCGGRDATPRPTSEPLAQEAFQATWLWSAMYDDGVDMQSLAEACQRWLGCGAEERGWRAPGDVPPGTATPLAVRLQREDAAAIESLGVLWSHVSCTMGMAPESFGRDLPEGYLVGALGCDALGQTSKAERARNQMVTLGLEVPPLPSAGGSPLPLRPGLERSIEVAGESLEYRFYLPEQFGRAAAALRAEADVAAGGETPQGTFARFAATVGTSNWTPEETPGGPPSGEQLLATLEDGSGRTAAAEIRADEWAARWRASLETHPTPELLQATDKAMLLSWFRRALQRDIGLKSIDDGDPRTALMLLETAAGSGAGLSPGPGRDPLLLAALARARYEQNELRPAAELLREMGQQEGWEVATALAEAVARVAVLPTPSETQVRR